MSRRASIEAAWPSPFRPSNNEIWTNSSFYFDLVVLFAFLAFPVLQHLRFAASTKGIPIIVFDWFYMKFR